jgi:hypothetical protein
MTKRPRYAICVKNRGYSAALDVMKIYRVLPDRRAEARELVRIVDESGEDYLYPAAFFVPIEVPEEAIRAFPEKVG